MHKYWSKKPSKVIRSLIKQFTVKNDIILDPFCGSGVSIMEAILNNRKAIGIDINPSAIFITKQLISSIDLSLAQSEFNRIENILKEKINKLYIVVRNDEKHIGTHFIWDSNNLIEVWYRDIHKKKRIRDQSIEIDYDNAINFDLPKNPIINQELFINSRVNIKEKTTVGDLFSKRNLVALDMLYNEIETIQNTQIKEFFQFCFTSSLGQASKMVFVLESKNKTTVGSWVVGYWIPQKHFEINVWNCFSNRYHRILRAKEEQLKLKYNYKYTSIISDFTNTQKNVILKNDNSLNVLRELPDNCIDFILTDPPHGDRIPYLELSVLWNSWLKFPKIQYDEELVISNAKDRNLNIELYNLRFKIILQEIYRILKVDHFFCLIFNSLDDETWIALLNNLMEIGFQFYSITTMTYSAGSVIQDSRKQGLKSDFILVLEKSHSLKINHTINLIDLTEEYKDKINEYIEVNPYCQTYQILNYIIPHLFKSYTVIP
ncbi:MAG: site-specific DNA-methyltransferase, partial [Candidatus Heimdallarchaeota archaeon]|nr:site-specific DNA-methyltransferase [Candidatus Heimdallarchaeota archaeon]